MSTDVAARPRPLVLGDLVATTRVRDVALVVGLALVIAASAQVRIGLPFSVVPITGQTFAVLLGAAALGTRRGAAGTALYVALGLTGVPWFAVTGGATTGYLVGFVVAAAVVGRLAARGADRTVPRAVGLMALGNLTIYVLGVTGLVAIAGLDVATGVTTGVLPFLVGDALKIAVAATLLPAAWRAVHRSDDV